MAEPTELEVTLSTIPALTRPEPLTRNPAFDEHHQERIAQWAAQNRNKYWDEFWRRCGISALHRRAVCQKIDRRDSELDAAVDAAIDFCGVGQPMGGLYLHGPVGCGKTLIACKMLYLFASNVAEEKRIAGWEYDSQPYPPDAQIVSVPMLLANIRATFDQTGASAQEIVNRYQHCWFLVMDDIGAEKPTEWVRDTLLRIVDWRYGYLLPTVFTSNCSLRELAERLGERIADRILEMCHGRIVEITCGSYRGGTRE